MGVFASFMTWWLSQAYAFSLMVVTPGALLFFVVPESAVGQAYVTSSVALVFVSLWTLLQTYAAWWGFGAGTGFLNCKTGGNNSVGPAPARDPSIAYIIPAYLNNEADILDDTISAYCNMQYKGDILVLVVFNSKGDKMSETESALFARWDGIERGGKGGQGHIRIRVVKNDDSSSKAENVNFALDLIRLDVEYTAIMDADHQPSPSSATVATGVLQSEGYDILQGACTIRNHKDNFLSQMLSVEFEQIYCVAHPGRFRVFDLGLFVGSNGYWKTSVLREIEMDKSMLTEDVDSSIRAVLAGYKIGQSIDVVSSELSPLCRRVLQKQRLRWAQGWTEVSSKHVLSCIRSPHLSLKQKVGIVHILGWREIVPYTTFWPLWSVLAGTFRVGSVEFVPFWTALSCVLFSFGVARVVAAYALSRGAVGSSIEAFVMFSVWGMLFEVYINYLQICGHGRCILKANEWVATVRS